MVNAFLADPRRPVDRLLMAAEGSDRQRVENVSRVAEMSHGESGFMRVSLAPRVNEFPLFLRGAVPSSTVEPETRKRGDC